MKNIILPVIRQIDPGMTVYDIISVQPMSGPVGQIFSMKASYGPSNLEILFKDREIIVTDMTIAHTSVRLFIAPGNEEPNRHYRPWLEEHVGVQGVNWNWHLNTSNGAMVDIEFNDTEHAALFELTWP